MKRALASVGVSLILFFPTTYEPEVSYLAHALGFGVGIAVAFLYFKLRQDQIRKQEYWEMDWMELILNKDAKTETGLNASAENISFLDSEGEWFKKVE